MAYLEESFRAVAQLAHKVARDHERFELSGLSPEHDGVEDPYAEALKQLSDLAMMITATRLQIERLRGHAHDFGADDYCVLCGKDGRA